MKTHKDLDAWKDSIELVALPKWKRKSSLQKNSGISQDKKCFYWSEKQTG